MRTALLLVALAISPISACVSHGADPSSEQSTVDPPPMAVAMPSEDGDLMEPIASHDGHYRVGVAVENVTPNLGSAIASSNPAAPLTPGLHLVSSGDVGVAIDAPLLVSALSVSDEGSARRVVLVAIDTTGIDFAFVSRVRTRVAISRGLAPEEVLLNSSHTHSAPSSHDWPTLAARSLRHADPAYVAFLEDGVVRAIERAVDQPRPSVIRFVRGTTSIGRNRRGGSRALSTEYDPTLDVLSVEDAPGGTLRAVAFFHGAHPTGKMTSGHFGPDYPGIARDIVRAKVGPLGAPAVVPLFFQGFGGDIGPHGRVEEMGTRLGNDVAALAGRGVPLRGPLAVFVERASLPLQDLGPVFPAAGRSDWNDWMDHLRKLDAVPTSLPAEIQTVRIGAGSTSWRLVATSHETVTEYASRFRNAWPQPGRVTLAGYTNGVSSYLPTQAMITADQYAWSHRPKPSDWCCFYEGFTSFFGYGLPGPFGRGPTDSPFARSVESELFSALETLTTPPAWRRVDEKALLPNAARGIDGARPIPVTVGNDRMEVFLRSNDGSLRRTSSRDGHFGPWDDVTKTAKLRVRLRWDPAVASFGSSTDLASQRVSVAFVTETSQLWLLDSCGNECWSGHDLGSGFAERPVVVSSAPESLDLFARTGTTFAHAHRDRSAGEWAPWSALPFGNDVAPGARIAVGSQRTGTLDLFYRNATGALVWSSLEEATWSTPRVVRTDALEDPALTRLHGGALQVAVRTTTEVCTARIAGTVLGAWVCVPGVAAHEVQVVSRAPRRIEIYARLGPGSLGAGVAPGSDDAICRMQLIDEVPSAWSCFGKSSHPWSVIAALGGDETFLPDATGAIWHFRRSEGGI